MKVIGFRTTRDVGARPGEQIVHLAQLACGHLQRVGHGHVPERLICLDGCDAPRPGRCEVCAQEKTRTVIVGEQRMCDECFYQLRDRPKG